MIKFSSYTDPHHARLVTAFEGRFFLNEENYVDGEIVRRLRAEIDDIVDAIGRHILSDEVITLLGDNAKAALEGSLMGIRAKRLLG